MARFALRIPNYELADGRTIEAKSASELITQMHLHSLAQAVDDQAYMEDVADRTILQDGGKVRTSSPEAFVNDLIMHGLIKVIAQP